MANKKKRLLPFEVIEQAANGDAEAMTAIVRHYKAYMTWLGVKYHNTNTETHGRMETKLMLAILQFRVKSDID